MGQKRESSATGIGLCRRFLIASIALLFCALGAAISIWWLHDRKEEERLRDRVQQKLGELKAMGIPTSFEDLDRLYPKPTADNDAGLLFQRAFSLLVSSHGFEKPPWHTVSERRRRFSKWEPSVREDLIAFVASNQPALEALPEAFPAAARFDSDWASGMTNGSRLNLPRISDLLLAFCGTAIIEAHRGNRRSVGDCLLWAHRLVRAVPKDCSVWHTYSRCLEDEICMTIETVLNQTILEERQLLVLDGMLGTAETNGLATALAGQRCIGIWGFDHMRSGLDKSLHPSRISPSTTIKQLATRRLADRIVSNRDFLDYLNHMEMCVDVLGRPPRERLQEVELIDRQALESERGAIFQIVWMPLGKVFKIDAETGARRLAARASVAIERYRVDHANRLPESLEELVPEYLPGVPMDPFAEQLLRYRRLDRGYVVYSIGSDGLDNGGLDKSSPDAESKQYDITFVVER